MMQMFEGQDDAACLDMEPSVFFQRGDAYVTEAKLICRTCRVREACLDYAMEENEQYGVWGGLSEGERQALRRSIRRAS